MGQTEGRGKGKRIQGPGAKSLGRAQGALGGRPSPAPCSVPVRVHRRWGLPARPGAPAVAPPPRPRSGLIRTTLQGSERFAREGEAPAPAAGRRASEDARGCRWLPAAAIAGRAVPLGAPLTLWRSQIRLLERGEGGDIRCLPGAGRKGEGGKDPGQSAPSRFKPKQKD